MSLVFSNSANSSGIVELIDDIVKSNSTTYPIASKTRDINLALDRVFSLIFDSAGTWQFDDSNQTDYPIIKTNIVSGQRDYSFTSDANGNLILDIYKVAILQSSSSTTYVEIDPVDVQSDPDMAGDFNSTTTGIPTEYDKTANAIIFRTTPNYNATNGLLLYINREASYFTTSDTTKKPGFAGLFHKYLALYAAREYASRNQLDVLKSLDIDMFKMEQDMRDYYSSRERDVPHRLTPALADNR